MTPAGQALMDELKRISTEMGNTDDGCKSRELFGIEPFNTEEMQGFIMNGYDFIDDAKGDKFKTQISVAVAWMYMGYQAAMRELSNGVKQ